MRTQSAVFDLQKDIVADYTSFINSFINIADPEIRDTVVNQVNEGRFWPEPLIQFNPSFEIQGPVSSFCGKKKLLHPLMEKVVGPINLFKHQVSALEKGTNQTNFIVTSGTGSGKSLTYIGTIFNHLLSAEKNNGIRAVIVYPMNALINSQLDSLIEYKKNYETATNQTFPITFARYTGQESEKDREVVREQLPDILLTNYMMLELILTRSHEYVIRDSIFRNIRYLVFDELHTYRGRQGADVAMLIRKVKAQASNPIVFIGTSATMVSGGTMEEQREKVAVVATKIFGEKFNGNQIITETLFPCFEKLPGNGFSKELIADCIRKHIDINDTEQNLKSFPLAAWLEQTIALSSNDGELVRGEPLTLSEITQKLATVSGEDGGACEQAILSFLKWISNVNSRLINKKYSYLPFRIHRFISQTGTVYLSLGKFEDKRFITLDPSRSKQQGDNCVPVFPTVFSRYSGCAFVCVTKNKRDNKLQPREFGEILEEDADNLTNGYLILDRDAWDPDEDIEYLPDSWGRYTRDGFFKVSKEVAERLPEKLYYDDAGNFSTTAQYDDWGWFMPSPLLFDPSAGIFYYSHTSESTKLGRLGCEGRSTSTTVLSFTILKHLIRYGFHFKDQKLLSFTDNRQDAALQAGHFNDYMRIIRTRAAINKAVSLNKVLDYSQIDQALLESLNMKQEEYAKNPSDFPSAQRENEKALKYYLMYQALYDLRHGWRVVLPNLEQCALLRITYKNLLENCSVESAWARVPILSNATPEQRVNIIFNILEYFRKGYSIYNSEYLTSKAIAEKSKIVRERLKEHWSFDEQEQIQEPNYFRIIKLPDVRTRLFTQSIGPRTPLGKYIKQNVFIDEQHRLNDKEYVDFMEILLKLMVNAGWIECSQFPERHPDAIDLYQLRVDQILWTAGDQKTIQIDQVRNRSYKNIESKPNLFFQSVYQTDFSTFEKTFYGKEHTGQLNSEDRQDREEQFKEGKCSVLFCSPTMELGVDIKDLNVVHMRNVPPNPSNYAQRSGRAGRSGQAALVFVNCSNYSPHDRHYFREKQKMVAGTVAPPKLDLYNLELLESHLHSLYLAKVGLPRLQNSVAEIIETDNPDYPLKSDVIETLKLSVQQKNEIKLVFNNMVASLREHCGEPPKWFNPEWFDITISNAPRRFNEAFQRWRILYKSAIDQLDSAQSIIRDGRYRDGSAERKDAHRNVRLAERQRDLLINDIGKNKNAAFSEFYPYRYLAAEGFLPGYNFTRLPIRSFIPIGVSGDYISRPRFVALREFGPRNRIYHNGYRYRVDQVLVQEAEKSLTKVKISVNCGYALMENDGTYDYEVCPFSNVRLNEGANKDHITDLLEMSETRCKDESRITCEEEERLRQGYQIETYFTVTDLSSIRDAVLKVDNEEFMKIRFIPAAKLIQINRGWRISGEDGFCLGLKSGQWKTPKKPKKNGTNEPSAEELRTVKLYTSDTADALYLIPIKPLALSPGGVITMQYALKRAIEKIFQVESNEIAASLMGNPKDPNIMLYESAQGSLGVLSQFMDDPGMFRTVVEEAKRLCRFDEPEYKEPASYDDLLSYYNQRDHDKINRFDIQDALEKLLVCKLEINSSTGISYEDQYEKLKRQSDANSSTEFVFLKYLFEHGLKLPDAAQKRVDYFYAQPDFYYEPNVWIFCDGSPHDDSTVKENDTLIRNTLRAHGDQVIVYYYKDDLDQLTSRRPDIFQKVR